MPKRTYFYAAGDDLLHLVAGEGPGHAGAVGGLVGMIGGLGGFVLPLMFGIMNDLTHVWTSCFMLLFVLVAIALTWMHFAIRIMERRAHPELKKPAYLPELSGKGK